MYRALFVISALILLLISCKEKKPKEILDRDDMIDLLVDVHLTDGYLNTLQVDSARKVINPLYAHLFDTYNLDSLEFEENLRYYLSNPIQAEKMYTIINSRINTINTDLMRQDSIQDAHVRDSIRREERWRSLAKQKLALMTDVAPDTVEVDVIDRIKAFNDLLFEYNVRPHPVERPLGPGERMINHKLFRDTVEADFTHRAKEFNKKLSKYSIQPYPIVRQQALEKDTLPTDTAVIESEQLEN